MAPSFKLTFILFICSLFLNASRAHVICEKLSHGICGFAIGVSGQRCLIETSVSKDGAVEYQCRTSNVVVEHMSNYVESDSCVSACGVDRKSVGISSDTLLEPGFASKLCSPACYNFCPNIVDLYSNLAEGEGAYLPDICAAQRSNPHRSMMEIMSSGEAPGPISMASSSISKASASGPASGPTSFAPGPGPASGPTSFAPSPGPDSGPTSFAPGPGPASGPTSFAPSPGPASGPTSFAPGPGPDSGPTSFAPGPGPDSGPTSFAPGPGPASGPTSFAPGPGPASGPTSFAPGPGPATGPTSFAPSSGPATGPTSFAPGPGPVSGPISSAPAPGPISSAPAPGPAADDDSDSGDESGFLTSPPSAEDEDADLIIPAPF